MKMTRIHAAIEALGYDPRGVTAVRITAQPRRVEVDVLEWDDAADAPMVCDGRLVPRTDVYPIE